MGKTIAVFGATGQQGGAVVRAMLKDKQYTIRAITRNPDSEGAVKLKQQGKVKVKQQGKVKVKQQGKVKVKQQSKVKIKKTR